MILSWYHDAWDDYVQCQTDDKKILRKINSLSDRSPQLRGFLLHGEFGTRVSQGTSPAPQA